jgi:hypothetical protein
MNKDPLRDPRQLRSSQHPGTLGGARVLDRTFPPTVDSVGLGDRRGCDKCKELLESEQWLPL